MPTPAQGSLRLFIGPDRAGKLERIQALERTLAIQPFDRHQLDAALLSSAELLAVCRQQPAASPVRLVVIDQAQRLDRRCLEALEAHAPALRRNACVVLLVDGEPGARQPLGAAAGLFDVERFEARPASAAVNPFALTDALGRGEQAGALAALREQLLLGKEPLELLGLIAWQVQRWVAAKRLLARGGGAEGLAQALGLRGWQAERLQSEVSSRSLPALQALLERCWECDAALKSGRAVPELAIEQLVLSACLTDI